MPSNIEIKVSLKDVDRFRMAIERIVADQPRTIHQEDIFFNCESGRLKLRIFPDNTGELIWYRRPDGRGPKKSDYYIYPTTNPTLLRKTLSAALGETVTVRKTRHVYHIGQTRIHLDEVEGLGTFMELEVVLHPHQSEEEGRQIADDLMRRLSVGRSDLVACAYADLLLHAAEIHERPSR